MPRPVRGRRPAFRHRPDVSRTHLPAAILFAAAAIVLALRPGPVPIPLPDWTVWVPATLAVLVAAVAWWRPELNLDDDGLTLHRRWSSERFDRRDIARVEMAVWADRTDIHLILRGGGVRRIPLNLVPSPRGFAEALAARGIVVLAV